MKRKFDIRVWVLITDLNPLTIWIFEEVYIRFSAADYNNSNLNDKFTHLTNNSVSKSKKTDQIG